MIRGIPHLTDESPMPMGHKYIGVSMDQVPASYLHHLWINGLSDKVGVDPVANYIKEHLNHLKSEHPDGIWT